MEYLSTRDAAAYLGYTHTTFQSYVCQKKITPDVRIGNRLGFTRKSLDAFRTGRNGIGRPGRDGPKAVLTDEEWQAASRRFHAGESLRTLADEYGVSHARLFQKAGPRGGPRTGGRPLGLTPEEWAEAGRRFHAGEPLRLVAAEYGISAQYLHKKAGPRSRSG